MADVSTLSDQVRSGEDAPDFGALATAAGPAPAPVIKTTTPEFNAGAELQGTFNDIKALRAQQEQAAAEQQTALENRETDMAPRIAEAQQTLGAPLPTPPATPKIAEPPSRQLTDFLQPVAGESPENTISKLIQGFSLIATAATGLRHGDATGALAALSGALKGWHEGDKVRADRAFADWKAKSDKMIADWQMEHQTYRDIIDNRKLTVEQTLKMLDLAATGHGNTIAAAAARTQNIDQNIKSLQADEKLLGEIAMKKMELDQMKDYHDATLGIQAAGIQQRIAEANQRAAQ